MTGALALRTVETSTHATHMNGSQYYPANNIQYSAFDGGEGGLNHSQNARISRVPRCMMSWTYSTQLGMPPPTQESLRRLNQDEEGDFFDNFFVKG
jgi:hypothetical protein